MQSQYVRDSCAEAPASVELVKHDDLNSLLNEDLNSLSKLSHPKSAPQRPSSSAAFIPLMVLIRRTIQETKPPSEDVRRGLEARGQQPGWAARARCDWM